MLRRAGLLLSDPTIGSALEPAADSALIRKVGVAELALEVGLLWQNREPLQQPRAKRRQREHPHIPKNDGEPEEFGDQFIDSLGEFAEPDAVDARWTRLHFACQANWAKSRWTGDINATEHHTHSPASVAEIRHWLYSVLEYIRHEIQRAE